MSVVSNLLHTATSHVTCLTRLLVIRIIIIIIWSFDTWLDPAENLWSGLFLQRKGYFPHDL